MNPALLCGLIMLILIIILLLIGAPISISIGVSSVIAMLVILPFDKTVLMASQKIFAGTNSFSLLAIPFFILAGNIMNTGGIARRLINVAMLISGRLPGALAQTNIISNMLFGCVSGSGAAAAAAIGGVMGPIEEDAGYDKRFSAAVNIASAPTGMMIPPSNTLIVYSTVAGTVSISALFLAGYLPGILWGLGNMLVVAVMAKKLGYKGKPSGFTTAQKLKVVVDALPSLFLIIIVIGGILGGVFTATEGSAIAVVYSFGLSVMYRNIKRSDISKLLISSANTTSIIIFMIGISSVMSYVMAYTGIPTIIANALLGLTDNKYLLFFVLNIFLLILGTFMDPTPAILIFTPIFLPICQSFGMHPIHFGLMITFNLCIGAITPPVGTVMFTGCRVANLSVDDVFKNLLPFFGVAILVLFLVTYIPAISMFIPTMAGLIK